MRTGNQSRRKRQASNSERPGPPQTACLMPSPRLPPLYPRRMHVRAIAILGATGSIGTTTLNVVRAHPSRLRVAGLAAHSRWRELVAPAKEFGVGVIALADPAAAAEASSDAGYLDGQLLIAMPAIVLLWPRCDTACAGTT